ncbi:MAG TPA: hypothetical protein VMG12_03820 [Polyangiaceae bacterium]|nr:hypothetical protein [Polyangiaceae bacterium]
MKLKALMTCVAVWGAIASCGDGERTCLWDDANCESDEPDCASGHCSVGALSANPYCGSECQRLEELSQGCLGSHTEQECDACGITYTRVGGNDDSVPFYDAQGEMVGIQMVGQGDGACVDAWYGIDLSECVPRGEVRRVVCDAPGP